jgi:hypothetical protein
MELDGTDLQIFVDEFEKELEGQSDRGLVIVGAAGLDVVLEGLLSEHLNGEVRREEMFGPNGPLNEFSSRIKMAVSLGLISKDERQELELVRRIRNKAAHQVNATLSSDSLRDLCMALTLGTKLHTPKVIPLADLPEGSKGIPEDLNDPRVTLPTVDLSLPDSEIPKSRFAATVRVLLRILVARTVDVPQKRSPAKDFAHPEEPLEKALTQISGKLRESEEQLSHMRHLRDQLAAHGHPTDEQDSDLAEIEADFHQLRMMQRFSEYSSQVIRRSRLLFGERP